MAVLASQAGLGLEAVNHVIIRKEPTRHQVGQNVPQDIKRISHSAVRKS